MLQNARVAAFTVSELLRENEQGVKLTSRPITRLGLNPCLSLYYYGKVIVELGKKHKQGI